MRIVFYLKILRLRLVLAVSHISFCPLVTAHFLLLFGVILFQERLNKNHILLIEKASSLVMKWTKKAWVVFYNSRYLKRIWSGKIAGNVGVR